MNPDDERQALVSLYESMARIGPKRFMVLAYLGATADRVNGDLVASTSCREAAEALGLSRSTVSRIFKDLQVQGIIKGTVSIRGSQFVVPESVLTLSSTTRSSSN